MVEDTFEDLAAFLVADVAEGQDAEGFIAQREGRGSNAQIESRAGGLNDAAFLGGFEAVFAEMDGAAAPQTWQPSVIPHPGPSAQACSQSSTSPAQGRGLVRAR